MTRTADTFGGKLRRWFLGFAAVILAVLWLLQTVLLGSAYDAMLICRVRRAADALSVLPADALAQAIRESAAENSLLILITDWDGEILASADEHSALYTRAHDVSTGSGDNPYRADEALSWQAGAQHSLPTGYADFLARLQASDSGTVGYRTEDGASFVCGTALSTLDAVLYLSAPLGAVGAAAGILRAQLALVTLAALLLACAAAGRIARQFARPVAALCERARHLPDAPDASCAYPQGFCAELDALSSTLDATAGKLRSLENARRTLIANVSHDLRTPLTMIKGYAELVRDVSWADDRQRREDLSVIIREADRLSALVRDLLDYAAAQDAARPSASGPMDLSALTQRVISQFAPLSARQGCVLRASVEPDCRVSAGSQHLERVLYNLIGNALAHAGEGQSVEVTLSAHGDTVRLEVRDHGAGIPPQELPHIWERYFTARERGGQGGTGLGLAIARELLTACGARFGAQNAQGADETGCIFWFELPACADSPDAMLRSSEDDVLEPGKAENTARD